MIEIKRGIDLPISGRPVEEIDATKKAKHFAILGSDYHGVRPTMQVQIGDQVLKGQPLFSSKTDERVVFCAPVAGKITEINRGSKRVFQSIVIEASGDAKQLPLKSFLKKDVSQYSTEEAKLLLLESGFWTAIRRRPYSTIPSPNERPHSIFITLLDTNPLSVNPEFVIGKRLNDFKLGLEILKKLTDGVIHLGIGERSQLQNIAGDRIKSHVFKGVHPAGNVGTHIHFIDSVYQNKVVWHIGHQDVVAIGKLFATGEIDSTRLIAVAGPLAKRPRVLQIEQGAKISEIMSGEILEHARVISGSVFNGHNTIGAFDYLGRYHNQISVVEEHHTRELLGWAMPGATKFSISNVFLSALLPKRLTKVSTALYGSHRDMVPIGTYEKVMPLDILPTQLLRTLLTKDGDQAQALGVLELDEEDLALCTFVDAGKVDYGPLLRDLLTTIEKEG